MLKQDGMIMMTEKELDNIVKENALKIKKLETEKEMLRKAVLKLALNKGGTPDVRVSRNDFVKIYNDAVNYMFDHPELDDNDVYGYDVTVHWHGIYCNCSDGATAANHIIPAIENCEEEIGEE